MKRVLFFSIFLFLMFFSQGVYAWEYEDSYTYKDINAYVKIIGSYPICDGKQQFIAGKGNLCDGRYYINAGVDGDQLGIAFNRNSWNGLSANDQGLIGFDEIIETGRYYFPEGEVPYFVLGGWDISYGDYEDCITYSDGSRYCEGGDAYSWVWKGAGYVGSGNLDNLKTVNCLNFQESCNLGEFCDTSGSWDEFKCEKMECSTLKKETKCDGDNYFTCDNFKWKSEGIVEGKCGIECLVEGEEKCDGEIFSICQEKKWVEFGNIEGKCGYTSVVDYSFPIKILGILLGIMGIIAVILFIKFRKLKKKRR